MPHKRRGHDDRNQRAGGRKKRSRWSRQHTYIVLDDWDNGFSIYKMDPDRFDDSGSDVDDDDQQGKGVVARQLPEPPALRLESPVYDHNHIIYFSALGTKIFILMSQRCGLVYDAEKAALAVGAHAPPRMVFGFGDCMPVGEVLYLLSYRSDGHSFEAMSWEPTALAGAGGWSWKTLPPPPPTFTDHQIVISHALHPDGCTIFMTVANKGTPRFPMGTYSFNTREATSTWRWHGECALPFTGQGHFDAELGAWVGLHSDGYICSCQVISSDFVSTRSLSGQFPFIHPKIYLDGIYLDHQNTKEKLFHKDPKTYMGASLTCNGTGRFCLVECLSSKVGNQPNYGDYDSCVLQVTIFGVKYNHKGEFQTTDHRSTRSFTVSRHRSSIGPSIFWM